MHNNFYFLRQLSKALGEKLSGYSVVSCFSQNKNELVIELNNRSESFLIKAHLQPSFSCLSFPTTFHRAKKNSVDLFQELILKQFVGITQFENERSFALNFTKNISLIFKLHGNRSNILLVQDNSVIRIFNNQFPEDQKIDIDSLNKKIDFSETYFWQNQDKLLQTYFTLGKPVWQYLEEHNFSAKEGKEKWKLFLNTIHELESPRFYLVRQLTKIKLHLLPSTEGIKTLIDPIEAVNEFFLQFTTHEALQQEQHRLAKTFSTKIMACESYIEKNSLKLREVEQHSHYKLWADLLMANLHQLTKGSERVILQDFNQNSISIKLKPDLSIQKNAEIYYRKSKNQEIEINKLKESIEQKQRELSEAKAQLNLVLKTETLKEVRAIFPIRAKKSTTRKTEEKISFHVVEFKGFQIWIGKNANNNDELTQKHAYKEDLWLHAKDVAGSHVVIKHQANRPFPKEVIERAAELAAYNSKRKTETLCPVVYTPKKFVRKRKGDPPGTVIVEKENVIMVTPKL